MKNYLILTFVMMKEYNNLFINFQEFKQHNCFHLIIQKSQLIKFDEVSIFQVRFFLSSWFEV